MGRHSQPASALLTGHVTCQDPGTKASMHAAPGHMEPGQRDTGDAQRPANPKPSPSQSAASPTARSAWEPPQLPPHTHGAHGVCRRPQVPGHSTLPHWAECPMPRAGQSQWVSAHPQPASPLLSCPLESSLEPKWTCSHPGQTPHPLSTPHPAPTRDSEPCRAPSSPRRNPSAKA